MNSLEESRYPETVWYAADFENFLRDGFYQGVTIPPERFPQFIESGKFGERADILSQLTVDDPFGQEYAVETGLNKNDHTFVYSAIFQSTEYARFTSLDDEFFNQMGITLEEVAIFREHSHPITFDAILSPPDILSLRWPQPLAPVGEMVGCGEEKCLVLRSSETKPFIFYEDLDKRLELAGEADYHLVVNQLLAEYLFRKIPVSEYRRLHPYLLMKNRDIPSEIVREFVDINHRFLREEASENGLVVYFSKKGNPIMEKWPLSQAFPTKDR